MDEEIFDEAFVDAIIEEARRREIVATCQCRLCGEIFLRQSIEYIVKHRETCTGEKKDAG